MITNTQTSYWAQRLREYRIRTGITQSELANRCGLTSFHISRIENNATANLRAATLQKLNAFFDEQA